MKQQKSNSVYFSPFPFLSLKSINKKSFLRGEGYKGAKWYGNGKKYNTY